MKLSLFFAGVAFAASNNVQSCMKHVINNDGPVMERAMGAVACLERSDAYIQPGQCMVQFLKVISRILASPGRPCRAEKLKFFRPWKNANKSRTTNQPATNPDHHSTQVNVSPRSTPVSSVPSDHCCLAQCLEQFASINFITSFFQIRLKHQLESK